MYEKMTEKEIEFLGFWHDPVAMLETTFPVNLKAPQTWDEESDCIVEDSLVLMSNFTRKKIQDINIGDSILSFGEKVHDYQNAKILDKINKGIKDCIRITTDSGVQLECTLDHKILARSVGSTQWKWLNAENLLNHEILNLPYHINSYKDYLLGQLLGWIDSDGTLVKRDKIVHIKIYQKTEADAVIWLLKELNIPYHKHEDYKDFFLFKLILEDPDEFYNDLESRLFKEKDIQYGYLCGFILGDGHYDSHNKHWGITQKKIEQNKKIKFLLKNLNINNSKYKNNKQIYKYYIGKFDLPLYNPKSKKISKFLLDVKDKRAVFTNKLKSKIIRLELIGKKQVWDLTTTSSTFLANNILVHNCIRIRPYQFAMLGYDYLCENDNKKTKKQNMDLKKGCGTIYNISARNIGKSFCGLIGDAVLSILHYKGIETCFSSFDDFHLKKIGEPIVNFVENHKLFKMFHLTGNKKTVSRAPYNVTTKNGHYMAGINENINSKTPGTGYHSLHYDRFLYDEASYISEEGAEKRIDSVNSTGCIERLFGIPDLKVGSPLGDILRDPKNKNFICRLPQSVREDWDEKTKEERARFYGGQSSMAYKLNCDGELVEGAFGKYDMDRIRKKCYNHNKKIKFFEVGKEIFKGLDKLLESEAKQELHDRLETKLIINRLPCKKIIVASDIGTSGSPSEITIHFQDNEGKWKYEYQISLFKMIVKEQAQIFSWIYDKLGSCFLSLDCTNADGDSIRQYLIDDKIPLEHLPRFKMNQNIEVGFLTDEKTGRVKRSRTGQPLMEVKNTKEHSIAELEKVFYNGKIEIPYDEKFLREFSAFFEKYTGNRPSWGSTTTDHLHDSFLLFALCAWESENQISQNKKPRKRCISGLSTED